MVTVTHSKITGAPADPDALVDGPAWDAQHVVSPLAQTDLPAVTIRKPSSNATIPLTSTDIEIGVDTRSTAVTVTLPSAAAWALSNPGGFELVVIDYYGNAATNNITPSLAGSDSFNYGGVTPTITSNYGILKLRPDPTLPGWIVRGIN